MVSGYGVPWGHTRTYSNQLSEDQDAGNGYNWLVNQWAYVTEDSAGNIAVVRSPTSTIFFTKNGSSYDPMYGAKHTLELSGGVFRMTQPNGEIWEFNDFESGLTSGMFQRHVGTGGQALQVYSYLNENIQEVRRSYTSGGTTTTESFYYQYYSSGPNYGNLQQLTLRRGTGASPSSWTNIEQVTYTYYDPGDSYGSQGDLQTVTRQVWESSSWVDRGTSYYRYYTNAAGGVGFVHGLRFSLGPGAYEKLDNAVANPLTATNAQVAQYADYEYQYDPSTFSVTQEKVEGGTETYTFSYTDSVFSDGYNNWKRKTVETRPDGATVTVYTNYIGEVMLKELKEGTSTWITFQQFNSSGYLVLQATPASVNSYSDTSADLNVSLKSTTGLIRSWDYYASTNIPSGAAAGYLQYEKIKEGSTGTSIKLREVQYTSRTAGDVTIYPQSKTIVYQSDASGGSDPAETSFAYTWHSGTVQMASRATTYPVVTTAQNGSNSADSSQEVYDENGYMTWMMDARGFITNNTYDQVKGTLTQTIQDVNTAIVSGAPAGWSTPAGGGLNLTTDFSYDAEGRSTESLGPEHDIDLGGVNTTVRTASWTVYKDDIDEVWSGQGYYKTSDSSYTLIDPVSITRSDRAGRTVDQISSARTTGSGKLSGSDTFDQADWSRWSHSEYDDAGMLVSSRVYHTIPASGSGSSGTNYDQTEYDYDSMGRQNMTKSPGGTITRTVFDVRSQVIETYVGTNDTGATDSDPTGGGTGGNNMVLVSASQYDDGLAGGNGNLTQSTQYVDSSTTRVTTFGYDFRNRQVWTDGEEDFYQQSYYDNLDRVYRTDQRDTSDVGNLVARRTGFITALTK